MGIDPMEATGELNVQNQIQHFLQKSDGGGDAAREEIERQHNSLEWRRYIHACWDSANFLRVGDTRHALARMMKASLYAARYHRSTIVEVN